jgi:hypothetical protein
MYLRVKLMKHILSSLLHYGASEIMNNEAHSEFNTLSFVNIMQANNHV